MHTLLKRVQDGEILFCDGALGTLLQARGLQGGECPELWALDKPEDVKAIHKDYKDAGSDIVECNSFGGSRYKLAHYGLENRVSEINHAAAAVARRVAGDEQHVLGSIGPTGVFLEPLGTESPAAFMQAFAEQAIALQAGGADCVIIETMTAIEEATCAVKAAKENTTLTIVASFTFDPQVHGGYATMMGVTPDRFAGAMLEAGADILGSNCGTGPDHMIEIIRLIHASAPDTPIMAMPNAGMPIMEEGETVFKETPDEMASKAYQLVDAGASIIGGCCGTTPAHIAAMRKAILGKH
ncbi:MAG: homocysteine S-methyltransferase family protein [Kiritimatiellae bacterium]|nr:homocysteine S-methyltransferase family protein [Kiritimatiellia bacterium]